MGASFGFAKTANTKYEIRNTKQIQMIKMKNSKTFRTLIIQDFEFI